jgi:hypothetical protein
VSERPIEASLGSHLLVNDDVDDILETNVLQDENFVDDPQGFVNIIE